jgi:hypothetical protein
VRAALELDLHENAFAIASTQSQHSEERGRQLWGLCCKDALDRQLPLARAVRQVLGRVVLVVSLG